MRHSDGSVMYVMSDGSVRPSSARSESDDRGKKCAPWRTEDRYPSSQVQADDPADEWALFGHAREAAMPSGQYRFTGHTLAPPLEHEYPAAHGATVPLMHRLPAAQVSHCQPARGLAALVWRL
jgi:hypothetical protein